MSNSKLIHQHSDDGNMIISIAAIQAIRVSKDKYLAEVLLVDGNWIRTNVLYDDLISIFKDLHP